MPALALRAPEDGVLGVVAPLGLAASAPGPALVVDLDPNGPRYPGEGSLHRLVQEGPQRTHLEPGRAGMAVLRNGGIDPGEAGAVIEALADGWPFVVLRLPGRGASVPYPKLVVRPLLPGELFPPLMSPVVYQDCGWRVRPPGPGPVLPRPRASTVGSLLSGVIPLRDRWIRSWRRVWETPWE